MEFSRHGLPRLFVRGWQLNCLKCGREHLAQWETVDGNTSRFLVKKEQDALEISPELIAAHISSRWSSRMRNIDAMKEWQSQETDRRINLIPARRRRGYHYKRIKTILTDFFSQGWPFILFLLFFPITFPIAGIIILAGVSFYWLRSKTPRYIRQEEEQKRKERESNDKFREFMQSYLRAEMESWETDYTPLPLKEPLPFPSHYTPLCRFAHIGAELDQKMPTTPWDRLQCGACGSVGTLSDDIRSGDPCPYCHADTLDTVRNHRFID